MKRFAAFLMTVIILSGCAAPAGEISYQQVNAEQAMKIMSEQSDYIILDVRTPSEFEAKHIVGAINIPNEEIGKEEVYSDYELMNRKCAEIEELKQRIDENFELLIELEQ